MSGKKYALLVATFALAFVKYSEIDVPENLEEKNFLRIGMLGGRGLELIAEIAEKLNYGIVPSNIRYLSAELIKLNVKETPDVQTTNKKINGINVREFKPYSSLKSKSLPIMVYYHGGAYFLGNTDGYHDYLAKISKRLNMLVISVEYRMVPEYPFPAPTDDCYAVTKYVLQSNDEFGDTNRVILAGDSAGGNAVAVMTQKLQTENIKMPKLQVLIYPWMQMFNNQMPSYRRYRHSSFIDLEIPKFISWYLAGYNSRSNQIKEIFANNSHTLLIKDKQLLEKFKSYTSTSLIPSKYKVGRKYYEAYEIMRGEVFPKSIDSSSLLKTDKKLASLLSKAFTVEVSPGLAEPEKLKKLPKAIFVLCEADPVKDEGIIYSERLRRAGVPVDVQFYENCFHGCASITEDAAGFKIARVMLDDLVENIRKNL